MTAIERFTCMIILTAMLSGCAGSKSFVAFEVLEPAEITYPENVVRVGYMNRSPIVKNTFSESRNKSYNPLDLQIIDTIVCNNLRKGFFEGRGMTELSYLEDMEEITSRRNDTNDLAMEIPYTLRSQVFENMGLDALVVLEYYKLYLRRSYAYFSIESMEYIQEFGLTMEILWRVYIRDSIAPLDEYVATDTLYYVNRANMPREEYMTNTSVIRDGSREFGFRYGLRHIPIWTNVSRVIFRGGEELLRKAAVLTDQGEWNSAADLWNELAEQEPGKISAKANHNLAVYFELRDEIPLAGTYAEKALDQWDNSYIKNYKEALDERLDSREELFKQLR
ncbi:MAG: DUF6340 family protein [Bacteroidales bacterium]